MTRSFRSAAALVTTTVSSLLVSGCSMLCFDCEARQQYSNSSSLVGFLYPDKQLPPQNDAIPELHIPLRVGLMMLPAHGNGAGIDAARKEQLLTQIREHFLTRKFIAEIVIVPEYYVTGSGFESLEGVKRLYNLDLIAIVSHDQVMYTEENALSLTYLTIVGAFIVPGSRHEVTTLVDLAVVDPETRSLLLRAGGTDSADRTTTMVDESAASRTTRNRSFEKATGQMIEHFDVALAQFEADVKSGKARVRVTKRESGGGGGSVDVVLLLAALCALSVTLARHRRALRVTRTMDC
jgi:rhombotail lipoprotein